MPTMVPVSVPGRPFSAGLLVCRVSSTFCPRIWFRIWPNDGLVLRSMAKLLSVFSIGSWLS